MSLHKSPLHIQILIALIAGALIGIVMNPGSKNLEGAGILTIDQQDDQIVLTETQGRVDQEIQLIPVQKLSPEQFATRFPQISLDKLPLTLDVKDRNVRLIEHSLHIDISYSRSYNGQPVLTNDHVESRAQMQQHYPGFVRFYDDYVNSMSRQVTIISKWTGDLFLRLLKMVTIPLIVFSLISGVAGLGGTDRLGSMFGKTLGYYLITSMLAIITGIVMVNLIRPGVGATLPGTAAAESFGENQSLGGIFSGLIDNLFPPNPVAALADADFLSIISFSILFGVFIIRAQESSRNLLTQFFNSAFEVIMGMTLFIIHLAPIGVLAFMTYATASQGVEIFGTLMWYMLTVFLALLVHSAITMPLILKFIARRSPVQYARALSPALMTAFSTASSNGTLPLTMTSVEQNAGISNRTSSFVLPLGATINMDGTALYEAVAVLFIAQATAGFELSLGTQVIVAITALLASIGAAGIPHAGLVMMAIVLQAVGLPLDAQGVIIAVDRILDMARTTVNVWSDACGCAVVEKLTAEEQPA
ncbi:MAG: dicarboxylate/amino acid:cation symporter [Planctomycetaceae bacterium]|nr:dicarboxylate/amino acid:cation symporter [Planctomycetaceae bacterium]